MWEGGGAVARKTEHVCRGGGVHPEQQRGCARQPHTTTKADAAFFCGGRATVVGENWLARGGGGVVGAPFLDPPNSLAPVTGP